LQPVKADKAMAAPEIAVPRINAFLVISMFFLSPYLFEGHNVIDVSMPFRLSLFLLFCASR
jgi:hypothetical protein